jgi:hypothetical protein
LRQQMLFGDVVMVRFYLIVGDVDPEPQGLVHSVLHCWSRRQRKMALHSMKISVAALLERVKTGPDGPESPEVRELRIQKPGWNCCGRSTRRSIRSTRHTRSIKSAIRENGGFKTRPGV